MKNSSLVKSSGSFLLFILLLFTLFLSSCIQSPENECPPFCDFVPLDTLEYKWNTQFFTPTVTRRGLSNLTPIVYKDLILYDFMDYEDVGPLNPRILMLNKSVGSIEHTLNLNTHGIPQEYLLLDNQLIIGLERYEDYIQCWDLDTRELNWAILDTSSSYVDRKYFLLDQEFYFSEYYIDDDHVGFYKVDHAGGNKEFLFDLGDDIVAGEKRIYKSLASARRDENGNIVFYILLDIFDDPSGIYDSKQKVYKYNLNENKIVWENTYYDLFDPNRGSPVFYDNQVIFLGGNLSIKSLNVETGEVIWTNQLDPYWEQTAENTQVLLAEGKLFVKSDQENLYCLDASTGTLLWAGVEHGTNQMQYGHYNKVQEMYYHEGLLYYITTDATIFVINAVDGTFKIKEQSPFYPINEYGSKILIDPDESLFYFFDGNNALAAEMLE